MFAHTFRSEWFLRDQQQNLISFQHAFDTIARGGFLQIRSRSARFQLALLDAASVIDPDGLSTTVLWAFAAVLSFPFAALARRILDTNRWPQNWKHYWICRFQKRKSRSDASNYRGLQLTSQLSKAMERLLNVYFFLQSYMSGGVGKNHFAYRRFYGARDAILFIPLASCAGDEQKDWDLLQVRRFCFREIFNCQLSWEAEAVRGAHKRCTSNSRFASRQTW